MTSDERAVRENAKISSAQGKNAREYWQQPTLGSEGRQLGKNDKRHGLRLNHAMRASLVYDKFPAYPTPLGGGRMKRLSANSPRNGLKL